MQRQIIDKEWVRLLTEAKQLGVTIEEVRRFFEASKSKGNLSRP